MFSRIAVAISHDSCGTVIRSLLSEFAAYGSFIASVIRGYVQAQIVIEKLPLCSSSICEFSASSAAIAWANRLSSFADSYSYCVRPAERNSTESNVFRIIIDLGIKCEGPICGRKLKNRDPAAHSDGEDFST